MNALRSLRARLLFTYLGLIVLGFGGLTWLAGRQIEQSIYDDFSSNLRVQALLLASTVSSSYGGEGEHGSLPTHLQSFVSQAAGHAEAQVSILNARGDIVLDSSGARTGENLRDAPEIIQAQGNVSGYDKRTGPDGVDMVYTAAQVNYEHGPAGYVRLGAPDYIPKQAARRQWMVLGLGFLLFSIVGMFISFWLLATLTRPLQRLRNTALNMAGGDLSQRVHPVGRDEIGEVSRAFNEMAERVEAMVTEQRAFASNASHELRTPLSTVRLRTEALRAGAVDDDTAVQYIAEIDQEVRRMSGLVDDLILLSRLDANRLAAGQEQVDMGRMVRAVLRELAPLAESKAITLQENIPATPQFTIEVNMNHLRVVIRNLLENAIKYTPAGGAVAVNLTPQNGRIQLQIIDNGQGIAPGDLPRLGQRFYRGDKAHSRQHDGVGLGLSLVHSIVNLYHGELQIESDGVGKGTRVTVLWPVASVDEA
ncbi:MAG: HAMP domain-containing protein [Caldilineaceae bacterium]|nr:HAMP domain-containing protein [Caldilineaceae bacterium]